MEIETKLGQDILVKGIQKWVFSWVVRFDSNL